MSFWAAAAIAFLAFASNAAVSPLYRVYQAEFQFSATTLTLLFAVYIAVLLLALLFLGSVSDYVGRRPVMLAGLAAGAAACGLFLIAHALELLFAARALQGVAVGLIAGTASATLHDLRPRGRAVPVVSSAAPTGGQALGAIGASALAQYALAPTRLVWWAAPGSVRDRHRRGAVDAGTWNRAPGCRELPAAPGQCSARSQRRLHRGLAGPGGGVGARRRLSVAWTVVSRAAPALAEPALGRGLDLPAHRSRGPQPPSCSARGTRWA
jgi:Major Facilitator Superfamily